MPRVPRSCQRLIRVHQPVAAPPPGSSSLSLTVASEVTNSNEAPVTISRMLSGVVPETEKRALMKRAHAVKAMGQYSWKHYDTISNDPTVINKKQILEITAKKIRERAEELSEIQIKLAELELDGS